MSGLQVAGQAKSWAIADEDLERSNDEKTSSVHFLRFELDEASVDAAKAGGDLAIGIEHEAYTYSAEPVDRAVRDALVADLG